MPDIEAVEVLTQAKERLFDHGWGQFNYQTPARELCGQETYCLEEAIVGVHGVFVSAHGNVVQRRAARYVMSALGKDADSCLFMWNDRQESAGPVFDALDRAIEIAKETRVA